MLQFCQACGAECSPTYRFCPRCGGASFSNTPSAPGSTNTSTPASGGQSALSSSPSPSSMRYAGFWRRFAAYLIDYVLLVIAAVVLVFALSVSGAIGNSDISANSAEVLINVFAFFAAWIYFALQESGGFQGTIGKRALGLKVFDLQGRRISFGRATGRYFGKILSSIILGIGWLMVVFTQRKQALHDKVAGTVVLYRGE